MFYPNTLLILGNGFDLHCGLKSSYEDFFRSAIIDTTSESFGVKQLKAGVTGFWEKLLLKYYLFHNKKDYNWCDIERIIKDTLFSVFVDKTRLGITIWELANENNDPKLKHREILSKMSLIDLFLFQYCTDFYVTANSKGTEDAKQELAIHLLQQLNNLEKRFCKYLKEQIINVNVNGNNGIVLNTVYITNAINLLVQLTGFTSSNYNGFNRIVHQEFRKCEEKTDPNCVNVSWKNVNVLANEFGNLSTTSILSFNYTAIFDILLVESPCIYSNVHGKLCNKQCIEGCGSSSVTFGIDDKLIQENSEAFNLRMFSKTYRKMLAIGKPLNILPQKNISQIEIKFYGHSLSEADYSYFQSIFDYYDLYENTNVSLTFYYSEGYEQNDAIYGLISEYGKTLINKEQGKNLIHKLLLENRLKIEKI